MINTDMKAYVITLTGNSESNEGADRTIYSSEFYKNDLQIEKFSASVPSDVVSEMKKYGLKWNYPWSQSVSDIQSGLIKTPYETAVPEKRIACFLSHYRLWLKCVEIDESILIFEHDALFIRKLELEPLLQSKYSVISLNDPIGCTRKSNVYAELLVGRKGVCSVPVIDDLRTPQGLPGNSAYLIKPKGAQKLINLVNEFGAWPNDAIMCRQLMPSMLGCLVPFVTTIQKITSTTTK